MMPKGNEEPLNVGDLSELLILMVLDKLGAASIPAIVKSLATATENGKVPFVIGPSVEQVLRWKETKNEVIEERRGREVFFRITPHGKLAVSEFGNRVSKLFPRVARVAPSILQSNMARTR